MFCSNSANNKTNKLQERALRIVYDGYNSIFEEILTEDGSFTIHHQNIQTFAIEMFKIHNGFSQVLFLDFFHNYYENGFYSLRSQPDFQIPRINTTLKGIESVQYFEPVMWNNSLI